MPMKAAVLRAPGKPPDGIVRQSPAAAPLAGLSHLTMAVVRLEVDSSKPFH